MAADWTLFELCNGLAGRSPAWDTLIRVLINDYGITTALVLVLFGLWFTGKSPQAREQNQHAVFSAILSVLLANLFVKALNLLWYRPRPFAYRTVTLLFYRPSDSSFPSNPTSIGFCIATAVWLFNRKLGSVLYVLASLLGLARLCGGVHYPSDIVGGAVIGILSAYVVVRKIPYLDRLWAAIIQRIRQLMLA